MAIFIKKHVFFGLEGPRLLKIIRFMGDLAFTTTWLYQGYDCFYDFLLISMLYLLNNGLFPHFI